VIEIQENWKEVDWLSIVNLYESVNWSTYSNDPDSLLKAFENSTFIAIAIAIAIDEGEGEGKDGDENKVCGLVRSLSDDVSIHYLQDILIHPSYQKRGIGRMLFNKALARFEHVRTHMLLTDNEEKQISFYESLGYSRINTLKDIPLNAFVKMKGVSLS
jgi:ribosomal protein S18 acetylase RimI-like enzyme